MAPVSPLLFLILSAAKDDPLPSPKSVLELQSSIRAVLDKHKTKGVALALADKDNVTLTWSFGSGLSGPVAESTRFRIGSTSKMFTSLAALQLVEQGKLRLDAKYRDLAPEIPFENAWEQTDPVRIENLLEHTAGFDDFHLAEYAHSDPNPISLRDGLLYYTKSRYSRWRPGSRFSYCNSGPPMVAYVIEKITGEKFEDYVQKHFFDPLGMTGATFFEPKNDFAGTYIDGKPQPFWHVIQRPAGSISATASDMGKMVRLFLQRGAGLVQPSSIERMETPRTLLAARTAGMKTGYALHNYTSFNEGYVWHGHNGGVNGGLAELAYSPELGLGYAFMINAGEGEALGDISKLVGRFLTKDLPNKTEAPAAAPASETLPLAGNFWLEPVSPRSELFHALERILGLTRAHVEGTRLSLKPLLSSAYRYVYLGSNRYRADKSPAADLAYVVDEGIPSLQSTGFGPTMHVIPEWKGWLMVVGTVGFFAALVLVTLSTPLWMYRWVRGRIRTSAMPARFSVIATVAAIALFIGIVSIPDTDFDMLGMLGVPTFWSISLTGLTVVIALFALIGLVVVRKSTQAGWVARMSSFFLLVGIVYLAWSGWLGIRLWNYQL